MASRKGTLTYSLVLDSKAFEKGAKRAKGGFDGLKSSFASTALKAAAASVSIAALTRVVVGSLKAQAEQEDSINKLNLALANQGNFSEAASKSLQAYASSLQDASTFGDEVILKAQGLAASFGMNEAQIKQTTLAALDFSAATGRDLVASINLLGKAFVGETGELSRYGIIIDKNIPKSEKFAAVIDQMSQRFGGQAQAATATYAGSLTQLGNAIGDAQESAGKFFGFMLSSGDKPFDSAISGAKALSKFFGQTLVIATSELTAQLGEAFAFMLKMPIALQELGEAVPGINRLLPDEGLRSMKHLLEDIDVTIANVRERGNQASVSVGNLLKVTNKEAPPAAEALAELTKEEKAIAAAAEKALEAADKYMSQTTEALEGRVQAAWDAHISDLEAAEKAHLALTEAIEGGIGDLGLDRLEKTHTEDVMAAEVAADSAAAKAAIAAATARTREWSDALKGVSLLAGTIGGRFGESLQALEAIGQIFQSTEWKEMSRNQKLAAAGQAASILGGQIGGTAGSVLQGAGAGASIGAAGGPWGAAIGAVAGGILGFLGSRKDSPADAAKEAGEALGIMISEELGAAFLRESEETGASIAEIAKQWFDDVRAELRTQGLEMALAGVQAQADALVGAPEFAEIAARNFNTTFWEFVKDEGLPAALEAFGDIYSKLREAFGDQLPPGFEQLATLFAAMDNPEVAAALQFAQGQAQVVGGATRAGFFDASMTGDSVAVAEATLEKLREQGVDDKSANQLIAGLLQAELNAAIASGSEIDAGLQKLLDEAKANGVQILPDIAHQQLEVLKKIYQSLSGNTYTPPGGGVPSFRRGVLDEDFGSGTLAMLHGRESIIPTGGNGLIPLGGGGGGGQSSGVSEAVLDRVARRASNASQADRPINVSTNININEDPIATKERREDLRRFQLEVMRDALRRRDSGLMLELRRALAG